MVPNPFSGPTRTRALAIAVAAVVLLAGCGGLTGSSQHVTQTSSSTTTAGGANATTQNSTENATSTSTSGNASGSTTTTSGGGATTSGTGSGGSSSANSSELHGALTVVVGSQWKDLSGGNSSIHFVKGDRIWYTGKHDVTISQALATQGIHLTQQTFTYNGTTYDATQSGTYVQVRVRHGPAQPSDYTNAESVNPQTYTLKNGDQVWVAVSNPNTNFNPPGKYIHEDNAHIHGTMNVTIDGKSLDFSKSKFQDQAHYFHFENGQGEPFHCHSWDITLAYATHTLGIDVTKNSVTYNGTTYRNSDPGTTVKVLVNGHPVDPKHYRLMDGDNVKIVVTQNNS